MKASSFLLRALFGWALIFVLNFSGSSRAKAQATATPTVGASNAPSAQDLAAAKAAERRKRFEELRKQLENSDQQPQEPPADSSPNTSQASSSGLSLSPILVNMLVGETQRFSLFDFGGHKLTSQADWSVDDSSIAELSIIGGVPTLVGKQTGTVRVRAHIDGHFAEATVNVITPEEMKPGTIRWQAPPVPGAKPIQIVPAVPSSPPS
jgi:hypothetical protein